MASFSITIPDELVPRVRAAFTNLWPETATMEDGAAVTAVLCKSLMSVVRDVEQRAIETENNGLLQDKQQELNASTQQKIKQIEKELGAIK